MTPNHNPNYLFARRWWPKLIPRSCTIPKTESIESKTRHQKQVNCQSIVFASYESPHCQSVSQPSILRHGNYHFHNEGSLKSSTFLSHSASQSDDRSCRLWVDRSGQIEPTDWFRRHSKGMGGSDTSICTKWSMKNVSNLKSYLVNELKLMLLLQQQMMMLPPRTQPSKISWNDGCDGVG